MNIEKIGESNPEQDKSDWARDWEAEKRIAEDKKAESAEPKNEFQGQDAEVTVGRKLDRKTGKYKYFEGGWEVMGLDKKNPENVVVAHRGKKVEKKINVKKLMGLQPFQEGESVPVIRSDGKVDLERWTIETRLGVGNFFVVKAIEGKVENKIITKSFLIGAKLAEIKLRIAAEKKDIESKSLGDPIPDDYRGLQKIEEEQRYWQDKLDTITRRAQEAIDRARRKNERDEPETTEPETERPTE